MQLIKHSLYLICLLAAGTSNTYSQAMLEKDYQSKCGSIGAGALVFPKNSVDFTYEIKQQLPQLVYDMLLRSNCRVVLTGAGNKSEAEQKLSLKRVEAIAQYLEWYGVNKERLVMQWGQAGDPNSVTYRSAVTSEPGPSCIFPLLPR